MNVRWYLSCFAAFFILLFGSLLLQQQHTPRLQPQTIAFAAPLYSEAHAVEERVVALTPAPEDPATLAGIADRLQRWSRQHPELPRSDLHFLSSNLGEYVRLLGEFASDGSGGKVTSTQLRTIFAEERSSIEPLLHPTRFVLPEFVYRMLPSVQLFALVVVLPGVFASAFVPLLLNSRRNKRLRQNGVPTQALVLSSRQNGSTVNGRPGMNVVVRASDGRELTVRQVFDLGSIPRVGDTVTLLVDPKDPRRAILA